MFIFHFYYRIIIDMSIKKIDLINIYMYISTLDYLTFTY